MPRPRQRICLEHGLKLDLNKLMRQGCIVPGALSAWRSVWTNSYMAVIGIARQEGDINWLPARTAK
jgi:hypothetical protein